MTRTEVLVGGAGPAGIAAATAAAENGLRVIVLDDNLAAGGQIWRKSTVHEDVSKDLGGARKRAALERMARAGARVMTGRAVFGIDTTAGSRTLQANGPGGVIEHYQFDHLILATGARERFLPFPGWTLPGVFGAGGLQALVKSGYPIAGKRVVVAGTGPLLLAVAAHLAADGAKVSAVMEQSPLHKLVPFAAALWSQPAKVIQGVRYRATLLKSSYRIGTWVVEAIPATSSQQLSAVRVTDGRRTWTETCDLLATGYHLVPNTEIGALLGCAFAGDFVRVDSTQRTSIPYVFCAGEPTGIGGLEAALLQGEIAGLTCAGRATDALQRRSLKERAFSRRMEEAFALRAELRSLPRPETIVCRCEDVAFGSLREHTSWTDAKLQTRCGMGPCQGRVCGPAIDHLLGWKPVSIRQPLFPVPLDALCTPADALSLHK
jgi:NADPH-dependent 2,4-dienoyl-CoA reductase/sulfur reductase-like enzyme